MRFKNCLKGVLKWFFNPEKNQDLVSDPRRHRMYTIMLNIRKYWK